MPCEYAPLTGCVDRYDTAWSVRASLPVQKRLGDRNTHLVDKICARLVGSLVLICVRAIPLLKEVSMCMQHGDLHQASPLKKQHITSLVGINCDEISFKVAFARSSPLSRACSRGCAPSKVLAYVAPIVRTEKLVFTWNDRVGLIHIRRLSGT
jgi:hypothetical protein